MLTGHRFSRIDPPPPPSFRRSRPLCFRNSHPTEHHPQSPTNWWRCQRGRSLWPQNHGPCKEEKGWQLEVHILWRHSPETNAVSLLTKFRGISFHGFFGVRVWLHKVHIFGVKNLKTHNGTGSVCFILHSRDHINIPWQWSRNNSTVSCFSPLDIHEPPDS